MFEKWLFMLIVPLMGALNTTRMKQCHTSGKMKPEAQMKSVKKINHCISLLPNFLINFRWASEAINKNSQTKGTLKEVNFHHPLFLTACS